VNLEAWESCCSQSLPELVSGRMSELLSGRELVLAWAGSLSWCTALPASHTADCSQSGMGCTPSTPESPCTCCADSRGTRIPSCSTSISLAKNPRHTRPRWELVLESGLAWESGGRSVLPSVALELGLEGLGSESMLARALVLVLAWAPAWAPAPTARWRTSNSVRWALRCVLLVCETRNSPW
jgi:hypothetical protein